jgi:hypothetical protein
MLVSAAACGNGGGEDKDSTGSGDGATTAESDESTADINYTDELPDGLYYNDEAITLICSDRGGVRDEIFLRGEGER